MKIFSYALLLMLTMPLGVIAQTPPPPPVKDAWANLPRYQDANAKLDASSAGEKRIVFYGDSITDAWASGPMFFPGKGYIGRGISGQTTTQMLVRFRQDVIRLHPAVVLILAGTNDIAENLGPTSLESIEENLQSMAELARYNHIQPILCSVLPAYDYPWRKGLNPPGKIAQVNQWMQDYCARHDLVYLNYFPALVDANQGMRAELTLDGVHPNPAGYAVMEPLAEKAIHQALRKR
jgi:lysophospholipase L1-like esterase